MNAYETGLIKIVEQSINNFPITPPKDHQVRLSEEEDCPSYEFKKGVPNGECETDGHYMCEGCIHYDGNALNSEWNNR